MQKPKQIKQEPGLGAFYVIWPGKRSGVFYNSQDLHG